MSTDPISSGSSSAASAFRDLGPGRRAFRQSFGQLAKAIQSGDLAGAQQAFESLSEEAPQGVGANGRSGPIAQGLSQIGAALDSGDLSSAKQAVSSLTQKVGGLMHHHHTHHTPPIPVDVSGDGGASSGDGSGDASGDPTSDPSSVLSVLA